MITLEQMLKTNEQRRLSDSSRKAEKEAKKFVQKSQPETYKSETLNTQEPTHERSDELPLRAKR